MLLFHFPTRTALHCWCSLVGYQTPTLNLSPPAILVVLVLCSLLLCLLFETINWFFYMSPPLHITILRFMGRCFQGLCRALPGRHCSLEPFLNWGENIGLKLRYLILHMRHIKPELMIYTSPTVRNVGKMEKKAIKFEESKIILMVFLCLKICRILFHMDGAWSLSLEEWMPHLLNRGRIHT